MKSKPQSVIPGVSQESVLGPLIFLILIGEIDKDALHSIVKSFADDTCATKLIKTIKDDRSPIARGSSTNLPMDSWQQPEIK